MAPVEKPAANPTGRDGGRGDSCVVEMPQGPRPRVGGGDHQASLQRHGLSILCEPPRRLEELACGPGAQSRAGMARNEERRRKADGRGARFAQEGVVALPLRPRVADHHRQADQSGHRPSILCGASGHTRAHARRRRAGRGQDLAPDEERDAETDRRGVGQWQEGLVAVQTRPRMADDN